MNVVIIGMGAVGRHVAKVMQSERHDVVVVDNDHEVIELVNERMDVATLVGHGANPKILQLARVEQADLVVAATNNDEVNLVAAIASKQLGAGRTIARLHSGEYEDTMSEEEEEEGLHYGMLGIDVVVSPPILVADEMFQIARSHGALDVHLFAGNRIELAEVELPSDSEVIGITLKELTLPKQTRVGAIVRGDRIFVPGGSDALAAGDRAYLFGRTADMNQIEDLFCHGREASRVVIYGSNVVGEILSRRLSRAGVAVTLIVEKREEAKRIAPGLSRVTVVHGDGTDIARLEEEDVGNADLYFAVTNDDENNLMSGLLAKRVGCPRASCLVHRHSYQELYRTLGIDMVISPRQIAADHILKYARPPQVESILHLGDGDAEVLEVTAAMGSPVTGKPLSKINIPKGVMIGGLVGPEGVRIPNGNDVVEPGDTVVVLTLTEQRSSVEKMFRRSLF